MKRYILLLIASLMIPSIFIAPEVKASASVNLTDNRAALTAASASDDSSFTMTVGDKATLSLKGVSSGILWQSDNDDVASVTDKGRLTAHKKGVANITASYSGYQYNWNISVKNSLLSAVETNDTKDLSKTDIAVINKINSIVSKTITSSMTDYEKVKAIHDYIILNTSYDMRVYKEEASMPEASYRAEGALLYKTAVCAGYAEAFQLFMTALDIPNVVYFGTATQDGQSIDHAWNGVKLENKWYQVDVTWDDPTSGKSSFIRYDYFLRNDAFFGQDHSWKKSDYSASDSTAYLMTPYEALIVASAAQAEKSFLSQKNAGADYYTFVYKTGTKINFDFLFSYAKKGYKYYEPVERGNYTVYTVFF